MAQKPKLRRAEIAQLGNLQQALAVAADAVGAARELAREVQASADQQIEEHRGIMQKHLDRKDLRPHVIFRPVLNKNVWVVSFNSQTYSLGPYDPLPMDDDVMPYWWCHPDGTIRPCRSALQGLIAIVQDYCNVKEPDDVQPSGSEGQS